MIKIGNFDMKEKGDYYKNSLSLIKGEDNFLGVELR